MHLAWLGTIVVASSLTVPSIEPAHAAMSTASHRAYNTHIKVGNDTMQFRPFVQLVQHRGDGDRRRSGRDGDRRRFGRDGDQRRFGRDGDRRRFSRDGDRRRVGRDGDRRRIYRGGARSRVYSRRGDYRHSGKNYRRFRGRRPGYTYYYGGWWYSFPWWIATAPYYYEAPVYGDRCDYWHDRCVANWGYRNSDYYGCMRYYGCY
jgi:hypothetical protein